MSLLATIMALLPLLQDPGLVPKTTAAIATGAVRDGRLAFAAMGMGRGGVRAPDGSFGVESAGRFKTPGGVRIWAKPEGVKLDFTGGTELLISPTLRIHLRAGQQTNAFPSGIELRLADGTRLRVAPDRRPSRLGRVEVDVDDPKNHDAHMLFDGVRPGSVQIRKAKMFEGTVVFVGGTGDALFTATPIGPLLVLERVLASEAAEKTVSAARLLVLGDSLRASLLAMPRTTPSRSVQYPQVGLMATRLAEAADQFFADGLTLRPPGADGALVIPLAGDWQLAVHVHEPGPITLGLTKSGAAAPAVEWTVSAQTLLHIVRPDGGSHGVSRYFQSGIELKDAVLDVLDLEGRRRNVIRARKVLASLGAKAPAPVEASERRR